MIYFIFLAALLVVTCEPSYGAINNNTTTTGLIQTDARSCRFDIPGNILDMRDIPGFKTNVTLPIKDGLSNSKNLTISFCRGIEKKSLRCAGKSTSITTACLYDSSKSSNLSLLNETNSKVVGNVNFTQFIFDDTKLENNTYAKLQPEVYWYAHVHDMDCSLTDGGPKTHIGTRVNFECQNEVFKNNTEPHYIGFSNCTYNFGWTIPQVCDRLKKLSLSDVTQPLKQNQTIATNSSAQTDVNKNESTSYDLSENGNSNSTKDDKMTVKPTETQSINNNKNINAQNQTSTNQVNNRSSAKEARMNYFHKIFMISLVLISLVGFIVGLFILDKKTQIRIPLGNLSSRTRFGGRSVPYDRMSHGIQSSGMDL